jgi:hypothetical protein
MKSAILRVLRILIAQGIGIVLTTWGSITIPYVGMTIGAAINGMFKFIRDKFPKSKILEYFPL